MIKKICIPNNNYIHRQRLTTSNVVSYLMMLLKKSQMISHSENPIFNSLMPKNQLILWASKVPVSWNNNLKKFNMNMSRDFVQEELLQVQRVRKSQCYKWFKIYITYQNLLPKLIIELSNSQDGNDKLTRWSNYWWCQAENMTDDAKLITWLLIIYIMNLYTSKVCCCQETSMIERTVINLI